ncbi:hypothetical protein ACH0AH_07840 [Microbacterium paludicola]|uniref:hypothetical protein n=1 Tax=Microbacterium paludicola TaxID=300019 RepID=UPI00387A3730
MTDNTTQNAENAPHAPEEPQLEQETAEGQSEPQEPRGNREAAKYRKQLRDVEAERDALHEQVASARTALVDTALAGDIPITVEYKNGATATGSARLKNPEDLFNLGGISRDDLFDAAGNFQPAKLSEAVGQLKRDRPELFKPFGPIIPNEGKTPGNVRTDGWQSAFSPKR